ncbi:hypothetical protein BD410DRAFT_831495, partial [Rickenella mellea]
MRLSELRDLKDSRVALRTILDVIDERIRLIQEKCLPLVIQHGVRPLPEDLLRHIFELGHGHGSFGGPQFTLSISQVCRRFRSVALTTPGLWATLNNILLRNQLEMFISRSGMVNLKLHLCIPECESESPCSAATFLKVTTKQSHRWSHFSYIGGCLDDNREFDDGEDDDDEIQYGYTHPAFSDYYDLRLPRLTHLTWHKVDYFHTSDNLDLPVPFGNWCMPNLVSFDGLDTLINVQMVGSGLNAY